MIPQNKDKKTKKKTNFYSVKKGVPQKFIKRIFSNLNIRNFFEIMVFHE